MVRVTRIPNSPPKKEEKKHHREASSLLLQLLHLLLRPFRLSKKPQENESPRKKEPQKASRASQLLLSCLSKRRGQGLEDVLFAGDG
ncbi:hypothetical protein EUGRSUZ_F01636 [Eucalyptus grandis]|uniref:Uncharacterized protein n=2 Tax=Eucalyptus grandis TaxID=71139 RepID=A0ACC3KF81_EUCGR|nr:hypothetical protein EUGRSUZ_F01636 [Eucalyptus grandis]